jgi:hypothetical protein
LKFLLVFESITLCQSKNSLNTDLHCITWFPYAVPHHFFVFKWNMFLGLNGTCFWRLMIFFILSVFTLTEIWWLFLKQFILTEIWWLFLKQFILTEICWLFLKQFILTEICWLFLKQFILTEICWLFLKQFILTEICWLFFKQFIFTEICWLFLKQFINYITLHLKVVLKTASVV